MRGSVTAGIILIALNLLDAFFTSEGIAKYGIELEMNPIMRYLIEHYGTWCMFAFKGFFVTLLLYMIWKTPDTKIRRFVTPSLWVLVGAYGVVVLYGAMIYMA